jgi:hypothetical protein
MVGKAKRRDLRGKPFGDNQTMSRIPEADLYAQPEHSSISNSVIWDVAMRTCGQLHGDALHMTRAQIAAVVHAFCGAAQPPLPVQRPNTISTEELIYMTGVYDGKVLEREACAVIAETPISGEQDDITMQAKDRVAAAIRARGNT